MLDEQLWKGLREFNQWMKINCEHIPSKDILREKISVLGDFISCQKIDASDMDNFTCNRSIAAVDGSRVEYTSFFPYSLAILRTLAKCSGKEDVRKSDIITPLNPETNNVLEKKSRKENISLEEAYSLYLKEALAHMELLTALEAARKYRPYIIMLDGGFLLFDKFTEWQELCTLCQENNIILVGIIEEVATAELAVWLGLKPESRMRIYDREILFGLFNCGEYLLFKPDKRIKKDYCTVFARLGSMPQAIGCDFLSEQEDKVPDAMNFIYTLTPEQGQGLPLWLQITDAKVRIKRKEAEKLIENSLDPELRERLFRANRERRSY